MLQSIHRDILRAVFFMHSGGIIHTNITADNLRMTLPYLLLEKAVELDLAREQHQEALNLLKYRRLLQSRAMSMMPDNSLSQLQNSKQNASKGLSKKERKKLKRKTKKIEKTQKKTMEKMVMSRLVNFDPKAIRRRNVPGKDVRSTKWTAYAPIEVRAKSLPPAESQEVVENKIHKRTRSALGKYNSDQDLPEGINPQISKYYNRNIYKEILKDGFASFKLIGMGNACLERNREVRKISSRSYRAPEVILKASYDKRVDLWSAGCLIFKTATLRDMFYPKACSKYTADESHLMQIIELFGEFSPNHVARCSKSKVSYFLHRPYLNATDSRMWKGSA